LSEYNYEILKLKYTKISSSILPQKHHAFPNDDTNPSTKSVNDPYDTCLTLLALLAKWVRASSAVSLAPLCLKAWSHMFFNYLVGLTWVN